MSDWDLFDGAGQSMPQADSVDDRRCEEKVLAAFKRLNVQTLPYSNQPLDLFIDRILRLNVPYRSIYGAMSRGGMVYSHGTRNVELRIECRAQNTSGSVDEKLPYLFLCAKAVPESAVWIVLGGDGARQSAVRWLQREACACREKVIRVYTEAEAIAMVEPLVDAGIANTVPRLAYS